MNLRAFSLATFTAFLWTVTAHSAEVRTWSDKTGKFKVDAEFVDFPGESVRLRKADGKVISVAIEKLSDEDQRLVKQLKAKENATPSGAESNKPENAIVRLDIPFGSGKRQERATAYGFALTTSESSTVVISDRTAMKVRLDDAVTTKGFADASIFGIQSSKKLVTGTTVAFLGFDGSREDDPGGGVVVLRLSQDIALTPLKMAKSLSAADKLLVPKLPELSFKGQSVPTRGKAGKFEWTKWSIKKRMGSCLLLQIDGQPYRPIVGAPVLNQQNEVVGVCQGIPIANDNGSLAAIRSRDDIDAGADKGTFCIS